MSPGWLMALVADGLEPINVTGARASENFFSALGTAPVGGRTLQPGDFVTGQSRVAVISHSLYQRHFRSDPTTIGRTVMLDGSPHEIVGVMPAGFEFLDAATDVWAPLPMVPTAASYKAQFSQAFARIQPGISTDTASRELQALLPAMRRDLGKPADWGKTIRVEPLKDTVTGNVRPMLVILLAAVGLILLLAAVNLGTLVLGRSMARARELALRAALGASRARLIRQLAAEQAVLAAAGACAGLLLARVSLPLLVRAMPPEIPRQGDITLDAVVFTTVFFATVAVAVLVALVPVALTARLELQPLLRQAHSTETPVRRRTLGALVAAQIALAVVLGIGAGLMLRSLWNLQHIDPGFDVARVLTFRLQTTSKFSNLATGMPYLERVIDRVRALPGVTSAGSIQHLPMTGLQLDDAQLSRRSAAGAGRNATVRGVAVHRLGLLRDDGHRSARRAHVLAAGPRRRRRRWPS